MATEVEDTPAPWSTKGSRVYGLDTPWVEGNKASGYAIEYANKEILRVSIKGFVLNRRRRDFKGKLAILRVDQRTVALQLFHSLLGWNETHLLLIDLDRVVLVPCTYANRSTDFQCTLQEHENSKPYIFNFETMQDLSAFQEVFTGFSVQIHIPNVDVCLQRKDAWKPAIYHMLDVQLWRKVPNSFESLVHTHDGLRNPSQLPETGAKRDLLEHGKYPAQIHTTTASDKGLVSVNDSVMKRHASSLLVFSGHVLKRMGAPLIRIPIDGRISIAERGEPLDVELVVGGAKTSYQQNPSLSGTLANRSSATASGTAGLIALGLTATGSNVQASRLSEIDISESQELDWVKLEFDESEDRAAFVAALTALIDPHEFLHEAETHGSDRQSLGERGSLTRKYESAVIDADDVIPPAKQTDANPELTPLHKAKADQVNSSAPLSQPRRGLAGDSTNDPDGRASMILLVAGSLDSKFRPQQGLAGLSTMDPDGRPGIIPLVAGSLDSNLEFHGRNRSSEILDADPQKTTNSSTTSNEMGEMRQEHAIGVETGPEIRSMHDPPVPTFELNAAQLRDPPVGTFETNTVQVYSRKGSDLSASSISETSECEKQGSAPDETSAKQEQWRRRICRKIVVFMLWKWEQNDGVPNQLFSSPASFEFIDGLEISRFDKIKGLFETYSGREWDWWPFDPPAKPLESGKVRIRWQCTCGDQRWTDASRYLARKCQALVNENTTAGHASRYLARKYQALVNEDTTAGHESGNATSQSAGSAASHSHLGSVVPGSVPSDTSQPTEVTSNIRSTAQVSQVQDNNKSSHPKDLYVLLCIYQGSQILHSQILASKCQNDEAFFENLRQEYRRLRGFFRFWFSPLQFSHCDFVKFTRFYVNELAKVGHSLPIDLVYQYNPRPPGPHEDPPISPHEFCRRFYTHFANPCGRDEALERIPKRQKRFQVNLHVDGREDMWGLHVELRPSFLVVLMWQIVITAGGWAFMGWWLSRHHGDLQNAAVPVTLIVTAVMALWAPIRKGMTEAL